MTDQYQPVSDRPLPRASWGLLLATSLTFVVCESIFFSGALIFAEGARGKTHSILPETFMVGGCLYILFAAWLGWRQYESSFRLNQPAARQTAVALLLLTLCVGAMMISGIHERASLSLTLSGSALTAMLAAGAWCNWQWSRRLTSSGIMASPYGWKYSLRELFGAFTLCAIQVALGCIAGRIDS